MPIQLEVRSYHGGGRHSHDYSQILFPLRGSMRVDIEGSSGVVASHCVAVIPERHVHDFAPSADCSMLVLDVENTAFADEQAPAVLRDQAALIAPIEPWLWRLFCLLGEEIEADPRHAPDARRLAMTGLQLIRPASLAPPLPGSKRRILRAAQALAESTQASTVTNLAQTAGLGQSQFHALFRTMTGNSPKQFQLRKLLDRAADRLVNTAEPVSEIAYGLGYQNASSFNRLFRRRFGVTPSEFRQAGRNPTRG